MGGFGFYFIAMSFVFPSTAAYSRFTNILPANNDPLLFMLIMAGFFLGGAIMPILAITILSMLADVADEMELMTGKRQEGAIFSVRAISLKAAGALGGVLVVSAFGLML